MATNNVYVQNMATYNGRKATLNQTQLEEHNTVLTDARATDHPFNGLPADITTIIMKNKHGLEESDLFIKHMIHEFSERFATSNVVHDELASFLDLVNDVNNDNDYDAARETR